MSGLSLDVGLGVRPAAAGAGGGSNVTTGGTAGQMAFGPAYTQPDGSSTRSILSPNDPFGLSFWLGVAGLVGLALIRHSLPN